MQQAETYWLRESQASLESKPLFKTWQQQFGSFHDNSGIWRCGGRLSNADLPFATKHPALLDSQHHLFTLIALEAHARVQHNRVCETLTELKAEYWIIRGRSFVRRVLHTCVIRRHFEGREGLTIRHLHQHYQHSESRKSQPSCILGWTLLVLCMLRDQTIQKNQRWGYIFSPAV